MLDKHFPQFLYDCIIWMQEVQPGAEPFDALKVRQVEIVHLHLQIQVCVRQLLALSKACMSAVNGW